jgi:hypothetical protein
MAANKPINELTLFAEPLRYYALRAGALYWSVILKSKDGTIAMYSLDMDIK